MKIPRRSLGFVYSKVGTSKKKVNASITDHGSKVKLTAFICFTCSDSKKAIPVIVDLANRMAGKDFELVIQPFPTPWSRNAHTVTKLLHVVNKQTKGQGVFPFIADIFNSFDSLTTTATADKTDDQVLDILLPMASLVTGTSMDSVKTEFSQRAHEMAARLDFKYSCTRGVFNTPTFMLNDVRVMADQPWKLQDWLSIIDPLM